MLLPLKSFPIQKISSGQILNDLSECTYVHIEHNLILKGLVNVSAVNVIMNGSGNHSDSF